MCIILYISGVFFLWNYNIFVYISRLSNTNRSDKIHIWRSFYPVKRFESPLPCLTPPHLYVCPDPVLEFLTSRVVSVLRWLFDIGRIVDPDHPFLSFLLMIDWLIDWCLTPTIAIFQLYRGMKYSITNRIFWISR